MNRLKNTSVIALFFLVSLLTPCIVSGAEDEANNSPIITENENPRLKSPITLWARESSLSEVLKVLSERSGMNFVAGEGVHREKITIILNKTPLDEAINLLVRAAGLSYEIIGNSVLIAEPGKLKDEVGQSSYVVELKYARATEVAVMLSDLTKNVKIDKGGNRLICYTSPRVIREIERIVKSIDHPHQLVMLETRLIEVSMNDLDRYGVNWGELTPIETGVSYIGGPVSQNFQAANWYQMPIDFNISLDMLIEEGDAKILMDSKLTTTNNREANLHIGDKIPYVIQSYNMGGAGGAGGNLQMMKEEVGVIIKMTPHINERGQITLALEPEVSSIAGWKGPNADLPLVRVRKAKTTVRVANGQTILLAGLLSEEKTEEVKKLPVLGQIPLIGLLFQHKRNETRKTNLIIEITPRIINDASELSYGEEVEEEYKKDSESKRKTQTTTPAKKEAEKELEPGEFDVK